MRHSLLVLLFVFAALCSAASAQERVLISEFSANNGGEILDADGDASDWIELYNAGDNTVNLAGWHLTDDATVLAKWTFPATNLAPGAFLVVFASDKNRAISGQQLHTSFQLDSAGEYLALVKPDGFTVAHEFAPTFPPQLEGISYGTEVSVATTVFLTNGAIAKWRVPLSAAQMPADWIATNFNDLAWSAGPTGLGFVGAATNGFGPGPATNIALGKPAWQSSTNGANGPDRAVDGNYANYSHTLANVGLPATWEVNLGTNYGLERIILWNRTSNKSRLRDITVRILNAAGTATNFTSALLNPENILGGGQLDVGPTNISLNLTQLTGGLVLGGRVRVTRTPDPDLSGSGGQGSTSETNVLALAEVEVFGVPASTGAGSAFSGLVATDLGAAMSNVNASVLVRLPFNIPEEELPLLDSLTLRMCYDDGFVASLNGIEVARSNAPASIAWNSSATAAHPDAAAAQFQDFDLNSWIGLLQEGDNVLALHGLNLAVNDSDFLQLPQLIGRKLGLTPDRYFAQPTPGSINTGGALGIVADTKFSVDRGFFDAPFAVVITSDTPGAVIRFTTNGEAPGAVNGTIYSGLIPISRTTSLRAMATKPGWISSDVDTHTYVFIGDVLTQSLQGATNSGFPSTWPGTTPDYDMDPTVIGPNAAQMTNALRALPSMFLTTSISNLFDAANGIYVHPTSRGIAWERPASLEMIGTNGQSEFQLNCGLRIQGGAFRDFSYSQKKSLRVLFKSDYGPGRLQHDVFEEPGAVDDFDGLVLRAGGNDGYAWSSAGTTVQFTRDEFGRELQRDMGHPAAHGRFVHLYLNGLYWGLYNLVERPNEDFSASYLGGEATEWDAITSKYNLKAGDLSAWINFTNQAKLLATYADYQQMQGNNADGSRNPAYLLLFDKINYLDYMVLNIWGGNWDWPNNNYWMGRKRTADSTGFKFYSWDYENVMGNNRSRSPLEMVAPKASDAALGVGAPHFTMKDFSEYQLDFADRVQRYFFNGGLLTPESLTNRYRQLADSLQPAIVAESARWGDDNHLPAYGLSEWLNERDWILTNYLPQRTAIVLQQFRTNSLFPAVAAPDFSQFGGAVPVNFQLSMSHTNIGGTIFFTLDGSDPRTPGTSAVAGTAEAYNAPVAIIFPTLVRARVLNGAQWSALVEAVFYPPQDLSRLALTELMYHAPSVGTTNGDEFDFIELNNTGTNTLNLSGLTFTAGITFTFTNGTTLEPGQFFVLARNAAAFAAAHPGVTVNGLFTGKLDNGGETLTLSHPLGGPVLSLSYNDKTPWPAAADGFGFSLVPKNPGVTQAPDDGTKWRASAQSGGSPGADDPAPNLPAIVLNEVLTHTDPPLTDAIELYNPNDDDADLSGWFLTDDPATPNKFRIPDGTLLPGGHYLCFNETQFNATPGSNNSFALSSAGDDVYLFSATTNGGLTGYSCGVAFGAAFNGVSFGRIVTSAGEEDFPPQTARTPGLPNSGPRIGPVVLNEIHYHPALGGDEFVELLNTAATNVCLFDPAFPTNTWKLSGLGFAFPTNLTLGPGRMLLLVATNDAAFRAKYDVPTNVLVLGPFNGALQDSGERLELQAPDTPNTNEVPYVTLEAVRYNDKAPWPPAADGTGLSLQRLAASAYGNEPANWIAAAPTPGQLSGSGDTDGDGVPDFWLQQFFGHTVGEPGDLSRAADDADGDGMPNLAEYLSGTNPTNSLSCLRILEAWFEGNGIRLQWAAAGGKSYVVEAAAGLDGTNGFGAVSPTLAAPGTGDVLGEFLEPGGATNGHRFYRIRLAP